MNALENFLHNQEEAKAYLSQYGDSAADLNKGVTLSYNNIANQDPLFVWFSAGTIGSNQVGKVIGLANQPVLKHCESTQTIAQGFSYGNQEIHNNIVPLYHTYKDMGLNGIQELHNLDSSEKYTSEDLVSAFEKYSAIEKKALNYANEHDLSFNDPKVLKHIISDPENATQLKESNIHFIKHEQIMVNPMYDKSYFPNGKTVGEIIQDTSYIEKIVANGLELSGAKILDHYFPTDEYDFSIYQDRVDYFTIVFDEFFNILAQTDGLEQLNAQREQLISKLEMDFVAYGEHFQDENDIDHIDDFKGIASADQLESNEHVEFDPLGLFSHDPYQVTFDPLGIFGPPKMAMPVSLSIIKSASRSDTLHIQDILDPTDSIPMLQEPQIIDLFYHHTDPNLLNSFDFHETTQSLVL